MNNETAIEFYKKFGFEIVEKKEQYYKRIEPSDAYVLKKSFVIVSKWVTLSAWIIIQFNLVFILKNKKGKLSHLDLDTSFIILFLFDFLQ